MATEVAKGCSDLLQELDRARSNLKGLNENIRRIIGRDPSGPDQYNNARNTGYNNNAGGPNGGNNVVGGSFETRKRHSAGFEPSVGPGGGQRRDQEWRNSDGGQHPAKRRAIGETKSVFSRLSGPPNREPEYEKPRIFSRVIKEQPSKEEVVAAQGSDERSRARNRRIFGSLLGTLQKFSQEESKLKSKEEKKALIEKKLEEQEKIERENMRKEKQCLFTDRKRQQLEIRALEAKVAKLKDLELWEDAKRPLRNFIQTKTNPPIFYLPKRMDPAMEKKLADWQQEHQAIMDRKRQEVMDSVEAIEARFKADVKMLEENGSRNRANNAPLDRSTGHSTKETEAFEGADAGRSASKHDRLNAEEEEDDYDQHTSYQYEHEEHSEVPEGPALPASMVSGFKITIQNTEHKKDVSSQETQSVRALTSEAGEADASDSIMDNDSDGNSSKEVHVDKMGKNIQITFSTEAN
ncbi:pinin-like [Anopheles albimanus]|uniref:pinin-like n=1 Tax=Anopheles albimanus TaxID=7167 RepID=UPI00163F2BE9|nr:pinin-like [Anopheles albimanus]